jgi:toxin ParE1/3/4
MPPVIGTELAETDLAEILDYLDQRNPAAAERLAAALDQRCELLSQFPNMGRARDELASGLRSIAVDRYVIFYRVTPSAVEVLRILHGSRDIESLMKPDGPDPP